MIFPYRKVLKYQCCICGIQGDSPKNFHINDNGETNCMPCIDGYRYHKRERNDQMYYLFKLYLIAVLTIGFAFEKNFRLVYLLTGRNLDGTFDPYPEKLKKLITKEEKDVRYTEVIELSQGR